MNRLCDLRLLFCFMFALAGCLAGPLARADAPTVKSTTLPCTLTKNGLMLARIWIYPVDKKPVPAMFLVDSGTSNSLLTDTLAQKLGLTPRPAVKADGTPVLVGGRPSQFVTLPPILVGEFRMDNEPFAVLNNKALSVAVGRPVDGIIGANMLAVYPALFDFGRQQITVFYPSPSLDDLKTMGMDAAAVVPVSYHDGDFMCRVTLTNGRRTATEDLIIDTGADFSRISAKTADRLNLEPTLESSSITTVFGPRNVSGALVSMSVGPVIAPRMAVFYTRDRPQPNDTSTLGLNFLSQFRVLLDYNRKKMYLKPLPVYAPLIQTTPSPPEGADDRTPAGQGKCSG